MSANREDSITSAIKEAFGDKLTAQQLWAIVRFAKHARRYCRSNAALNNALNRMFPHASFRQVTKTRTAPRFPGDSLTYPGLEITIRATGESATEEESEE